METINVREPTHDQSAFGGLINLSMDDAGLLNITLKPSCTQKFSYRVEDKRENCLQLAFVKRCLARPGCAGEDDEHRLLRRFTLAS